MASSVTRAFTALEVAWLEGGEGGAGGPGTATESMFASLFSFKDVFRLTPVDPPFFQTFGWPSQMDEILNVYCLVCTIYYNGKSLTFLSSVC